MHPLASYPNCRQLISYDYLDEEEEKTLCIEQYGEEEFEVTQGIIIDALAISNILPKGDDY